MSPEAALLLRTTVMSVLWVAVCGHSPVAFSFSLPGATARGRSQQSLRQPRRLPNGATPGLGLRVAQESPVVMQCMPNQAAIRKRMQEQQQQQQQQQQQCRRFSGEFKVDGIRTHYVAVEPPAAKRDIDVPPLVLVHGFGANSQHFSRNMEEIAAATGARVYAPDLIGFGNSEKPSSAIYGEMLWSRQIRKLIAEIIQTEKVFLAGNSIGGYVAMNVGADIQSSCAGLVLINSAGDTVCLSLSAQSFPRDTPVPENLMLTIRASPRTVRRPEPFALPGILAMETPSCASGEASFSSVQTTRARSQDPSFSIF